MATRVLTRVLIPLDGSDFSRQILPVVRRFFDPHNHELVLIRVAEHPVGRTPHPPRPLSAEIGIAMYESSADLVLAAHPVYASQEWESLLVRLQDELGMEAEALAQAGYTVSTATKFGDPAREIVEFAQNNNIALIAMTTHGRSGLSRLISGSVAQQIVREAYAPVLLMRPVEPLFEEL
ncbi:MAG: universal stress protein [Chloroflexi bacterium]|nr:universal stress protein [Chloroflexota bacterium]MBI3733916.1 universal stress protein [Chloroflexota bacterium]